MRFEEVISYLREVTDDEKFIEFFKQVIGEFGWGEYDNGFGDGFKKGWDKGYDGGWDDAMNAIDTPNPYNERDI